MNKKYSVIYADPPWNQKAGRKLQGYVVKDGEQVWPSGDKATQDLPYKVMTVKDIANINVKDIADDATNKYLLQAEQVIKSWGFNYSACIRKWAVV